MLAMVAILACPVVTSGCVWGDEASGSGAEASDVTFTDSSGVEVVTNRGDGWSPEEAWRLEVDYQVGELDGPLAFGRINWVAPGPDDGMLVLDAQSHLVHVFDSVGRPVGRFGGEGDGPGEFRRPAAITPVRDGRLAVSEGFPPKLHWLTTGGDYLSSTRLPVVGDETATRIAGTIGAWQITSAGRVFVQVQVLDPGADEGGIPVVLMEVDPAGDVPPDTIASWNWSMSLGSPTIRLFEPVHTWMPLSDGVIVLSAGSPYEIQWHDPSAGLQRVMRREMDGVRVTERHRARAIAIMREGVAAFPGADSRIAEMVDNAEFEATVPEVQRVWVSEPDGRLWIGVHDAGLFEIEEDAPLTGWTNALDVFERDGRYLGRIPLPAGLRLRVVTADALYGVWEDELEVSFARRYRVIKPGA
jgi:hypothetical protein